LLKPLTSLRIFAAVMVLLLHCNIMLVRFPWLVKVANIGYLGVPFFFILSGFIIAYNYQDRLESPNGKHIRSFYLARMARIYPVHLLTFLMVLPYVIHWEWSGTSSFTFRAILNLLLLQSYSMNSNIYFAFNGASWTLCIEMFFYLTKVVFTQNTKKYRYSHHFMNAAISHFSSQQEIRYRTN